MSKNPKKKLSLKRNISNNLFALKTIWIASPVYLFIYLFSSIIYGALDFLSNTYLLREIINDISNGEPIANTLRFAVILGVITLITYTALQWFWNVPSQNAQKDRHTYSKDAV